MAPSASAIGAENPATTDGACRTSSAERGASAVKPASGFGGHVLDQKADQPADELVDAAGGIKLRKGVADLGDDRARQCDGSKLIEAEQVGAQTVVDVVSVVGDVVGNRCDLRLQARKAPELEILPPIVVRNRFGDAVGAITTERRAFPVSQRAIMFDQPLQGFPGQV